MKKINKTGFTIVETMIVLGISGVLFASVVALMSGQQSRARFKSSTTDMVTRFQSTANEAASGYYPSNNNLKCTVVGSDLRLEQSATTQGSNNDCIYLGRAIMFGPVSGDNIQEYYIPVSYTHLRRRRCY